LPICDYSRMPTIYNINELAKQLRIYILTIVW